MTKSRFSPEKFRAAALGFCLGANLLPAATDPLLLDPVEVLGSRIRRVEPGGPTAVSRYSREDIEASGALRLADFLNLLPQNYTGASSGRGSAPNDFNPEFGVRTESRFPQFNYALGLSDVPLGQTGVSGANLRGLGSGSTLVLVDGRRRPMAAQGNQSTDSRQGFVNLNTIPLGMVERIEVLADGASALYGSDAIGGVINVVLKKNYTGAELNLDYRGTFAGGAQERHASLQAGLTSHDARLRATVAIDLHDRAALTAAQRDFSANQDHSERVVRYNAAGAPVEGIDFRLNLGYPAVVQARSGSLNGVTRPDGTPAMVALTPEGARSTPAPSEFIGWNGNSPAGARKTNTAEFLTLVSPQESRSLSTALEYAAGKGVRLYGGASESDVRTRFDAQPPVSGASATTGFGSFSTLVPATIGGSPNALNPFGQDVLVGLVHHEFGPTHQTTRTRSADAFLGVAGAAGEQWAWDFGVHASRERLAERDLTLDPMKFTASLAAADPAQRFNPFIDTRATGPVHSALYATMTATGAYDGTSELTVAQFTADGPVRALPAGDAQLAFGGEYSFAQHRSTSRSATGTLEEGRAQRHSRAAFAELSVPIFGRDNERAFARRLEVQLAARYEHHGAAGETTNPKAGISWTPVGWLLIRSAVSTGFRAPSLTEYETAPSTWTSTLTDPRRTPARTPGVSVLEGSRRDAEPETSRSRFHGVVLAPTFAPGLSLAIDYHRTAQHNLLQWFSAQTLVNNEPLFAGRITRAAPTAQDTALGQPGAITAVDATFVNVGDAQHESVDVRLDYTLPWRRLGQFRVMASGSRLLDSHTRLRPDREEIDLAGDTGAPPRWRGLATLSWQRGPWSGSLMATYVGSFASNEAGNLSAPHGYPSSTLVNLNLGYTFRDGFWRGHGRDARIGVSLGNVFDRPPAFSDTVFGFNGGLHSPLGRTYGVSLRFPL